MNIQLNLINNGMLWLQNFQITARSENDLGHAKYDFIDLHKIVEISVIEKEDGVIAIRILLDEKNYELYELKHGEYSVEKVKNIIRQYLEERNGE